LSRKGFQMSHIHVCLVSDQPIPNLTTVFQFKPDRVILLVTAEKLAEAKRLEEIFHNHKILVESQNIAAYDLNNVILACEGIIKQSVSCQVSLNITGGTKIGTLGAFQVFYSTGKPIYYVNTKDNEIMQISPEEKLVKIGASISIKDYLSAYGFKVTDNAKDDSYIYKRKAITEHLKKMVIDDERMIGDINFKIPKIDENTKYPFTLTFGSGSYIEKLLDMLHEANMAQKISPTSICISNEETAKYLKGFWFEEYVYMIAKSLSPDEIMLNVEGDWDVKGAHTPQNEFDILISKKNRLFYISCKTANPNRIIDNTEESITKDYLYELLALGDRALGLFGKKMLASARPIANKYVKKRADMMKITIIDGKNILTLKENLNQWLNS